MPKKVVVISLSTDAALTGDLMLNLAQHAENPEFFSNATATSMCSGYNGLLRFLQARTEAKHLADTIVCMIHNDARLHFNYERDIPIYFENLTNPGIVGFVGCQTMAGLDSRWWLGIPRFGGLIQGGYPAEDPENLVFDQIQHHFEYENVRFPFERVAAVDGYCMFATLEALLRVGLFDEQFDAWHCYDADICRKMLEAGFENYVIGRKSQHFSGGSLADPWPRENEKFARKWSKK